MKAPAAYLNDFFVFKEVHWRWDVPVFLVVEPCQHRRPPCIQLRHTSESHAVLMASNNLRDVLNVAVEDRSANDCWYIIIAETQLA